MAGPRDRQKQRLALDAWSKACSEKVENADRADKEDNADKDKEGNAEAGQAEMKKDKEGNAEEEKEEKGTGKATKQTTQ